MLKRLTVDNYRSLERVQVALHPFTAFVGANGTGKSSLLRAIDLVLGQRYPNVSSSAFQQNYVAGGSVTGATRLEDPSVVTQWFFLTGVSVRAARPRTRSSLWVTRSLTGANSTVGANHRYPDFLAARFRATPALEHLGVLNKGISGNRLLHDDNVVPSVPFAPAAPLFGESALARFDRDVVAQPGARYIIVLLGINDIGHPASGIAPASEAVTADDLITAHRQLIARGQERRLEMFGATILPFEGDTLNFFTEEGEAKRRAVNRWIRTSGEYDGVIDFDRALRDPGHPLRLLPAYDSGDHLHPNDAGMAAMAGRRPVAPLPPRQPLGRRLAAAVKTHRVEAEDLLGSHDGGLSREPKASALGVLDWLTARNLRRQARHWAIARGASARRTSIARLRARILRESVADDRTQPSAHCRIRQRIERTIASRMPVVLHRRLSFPCDRCPRCR